MTAVITTLTLLFSYLVGAIPFGYLVARARGVDILKAGSGNIGATNVGRVLGRPLGIVVFLLDFAKGAIPVAVAIFLSAHVALPPDALPVGAGLAAFLGHMFPVYLGFRGGKGVATGAGVVTVLLPLPTLVAFGVWVATVLATRYVSLGSIFAVLGLTGSRFLLTSAPFAADTAILTGFCCLAAVLVIARHAANVRRLAKGEENRLRESGFMQALTRTIHVLAVGLWFGTAIFFTFVVGLSLFATFEALTAEQKRPIWLPAPEAFERPPPSDRFPDPLRKEQGSRIAGAAVGPMFPWYYGIQSVCAVFALATGLAWYNRGRLHRLRVWLLALAVVTLVLGWWLEHVVSEMRVERSQKSDTVLESPQPTSGQIEEANAIRREFGLWHFYSLMQNFLTVALVTVVMGMAGTLPRPDHTGPPAVPA